MMRRRLVAFAALTIVLLIAAAPSAASVQERPALDLEAAIQFRATFGLRADADYAIAVASDPTSDSSRFGVSLTAAEIDDLDERMVVRESFEPALEAAMQSPAYAGAFIDQLRQGQPVILTTDRGAMDGELKSVDGAELAEVVVVDRTLADLEALSDTIKDARKELSAQGVQIVSVGIDVVSNRVQVGIGSPVEE